MNRKEVLMRNMLVLSELEKIDSSVDFEICVFKGAAFILKNIYLIDERDMSDVDLFVDEKNYSVFLEIIFKNGYAAIENGKHSFYKIVCKNLPPVVIDLHRDLWGIKYDEVEKQSIDGFNNIKSLSDVWLFITSSLHCIINHAYIDEKTLRDLKRIVEMNDENFIRKIVLTLKGKRYEFIVRYLMGKNGFYTDASPVNLRDFLIYPFISVALKKHIVINEYIISLLWQPSTLIDFMSKGKKGISNFLLRMSGKMD